MLPLSHILSFSLWQQLLSCERTFERKKRVNGKHGSKGKAIENTAPAATRRRSVTEKNAKNGIRVLVTEKSGRQTQRLSFVLLLILSLIQLSSPASSILSLHRLSRDGPLSPHKGWEWDRTSTCSLTACEQDGLLDNNSRCTFTCRPYND